MSDRERFERAAKIFLEAGRLPADEVIAYVDAQCGDDAALRALVDDMLNADEGSVFRTLADQLQPVHRQMREQAEAATTMDSGLRAPFGWIERDEQPGEEIGRFRLLELIGEGGFGRVWVAEQREPVARRVALKVIKAGMDSRQVVGRFEQERQALAVMDHPNIAKVFDAGATTTGRPYFVMELCKGAAITHYCDQQNLSVEERLELFAQVCGAVQHAHTKGVIHRDIKPSNVLVSTQDGRPQAKVIDFGIAKAIEQRLTEKTFFTEHRQLIGTPEYMSPEQAEGSLDIDTRTDVYSLGVLLYELLTGSTPFTSRELRSGAFGELQRIIREVDPPRPSMRLVQSGDTIDAIAAQRRTEPRRLGTLVRGELDWIVMKALEKDRARRYESANDLAADVRRFLAREAVQAAPPSRAYRVRKFIRRHRAAVLTSGLLGATLVLGVIGTSLGLVWALREKDRADAAATSEAVARRAEAQRADELKQVADFQANMLSRISTTDEGAALMEDIRRRFADALVSEDIPPADRPDQIDAFDRALARVNATDVAADMLDRAILKPAVDAVNSSFQDSPLIDAALRHTLAEMYRGLARYKPAIALQTRALETRQRLLGENDFNTLDSKFVLARIRRDNGEPAVAEAMFRELAETCREIYGNDDLHTLMAISMLAQVLREEGKIDEAEPLALEAMETATRVLGEEHSETLNYTSAYGLMLEYAGRPADAEPYLRRVLETRRRIFGPEKFDTLHAMTNYSLVLTDLGRWGEAEQISREAVALFRRVRGDSDPGTLIAINNLANALQYQRKNDEAAKYFLEALEKSRRLLGELHPDTLRTLSNAANAYRAQGKLADAEPLARQSLEGYRRVYGPEHRETLIATNVYGYVLIGLGRRADAEPYWREAYETGRKALGPDHPDVIIWTTNLGGLLSDLGRNDEAEPLLRDAFERAKRVHGTTHPVSIAIAGRAANLLDKLDQHADAEAIRREILAARRATLGDTHADTLDALRRLAGNLRQQQRYDEAESLLRSGLASLREAQLETTASAADLQMALAGALQDQERWSDAVRALTEAHRICSDPASNSPAVRLKQCAEALVVTLKKWDAAEPGQGHDAQAAEWSAKLDAAESR